MRSFLNLRLFVVATLSAFLGSLPARADQGAGLPQLDTSLFPEQLFWLAISFALLYLLMSRVALPRVARTQANRKSVIAAELESARVANDTAKATLAVVERSMGEARAKAHAHVNEMIAEVAHDASARQAKQEKEMQRRLHSVEAEIAVTRESALAAVRVGAADLAAAVVEKVLGSRLRSDL